MLGSVWEWPYTVGGQMGKEFGQTCKIAKVSGPYVF